MSDNWKEYIFFFLEIILHTLENDDFQKKDFPSIKSPKNKI